jgi:hypothetical protein
MSRIISQSFGTVLQKRNENNGNIRDSHFNVEPATQYVLSAEKTHRQNDTVTRNRHSPPSRSTETREPSTSPSKLDHAETVTPKLQERTVTEKQVKTNVRPPHIPNILRLNEAEIKRAISCRPSNSEISSKRQPNAFSSSGKKTNSQAENKNLLTIKSNQIASNKSHNKKHTPKEAALPILT